MTSKMDLPRLRMLSGAEIVDRGRNVTDTQLPEIGTKEVTATGSWLEQKQVQAALEARKALVAVERIDKVGCLSHAEWLDDQRLAEVTQQTGGYWQYLGHKVNGTLYLLPEEALFLMETNCLLLKHNHVTVSLQKAYSLLLDDEMTLTQYNVYASLSRVGYKVFRYDRHKISPKKIHKAAPNKSNTSDIDMQQDKNSMEVNTNTSNEIISELNSLTKTFTKNPDILSLVAADPIISTDEETTENPIISSLVSDPDKTILIDEELNKSAELTSTLPLDKPVSNALETNNAEPNKLPTVNEITALSTDKLSDSTNILDETNSGYNSALKTSIENSVIVSLVAAEPIISTSEKTITENPGTKSLVPVETEITMMVDEEIGKPDKLLSTLPLQEPTSNALETNNSEPKELSSENIANEVIAQSTPSTSIFSVDENGVIRLGPDTDIAMETDSSPATDDQTENKMETDADTKVNTKSSNKNFRLNSYIVKKLKIQNRTIQSSDPKRILDKFKDFPDFYRQQIVTVNVPSEDYLPRNVFLNNTSYVVNTNNLSNRDQSRCLTPNQPAGNRAMYRTLKNSIESENAAVPTPEASQFVPNTPSYERSYGYYQPTWRPHSHSRHYQRPSIPQPRFNHHPYFYRVMNSMPQLFTRHNTFIPRPPFNLNQIQRQKVKDDHLEAIKSLARSLNHVSPNNYYNLKFSINGLICRFNQIYGEKMIITPEHHIVDTKQRIETIEIQDDEVEDLGDKQDKLSKFDQYLASIKMLAARLRNLARKKQPVMKQKRAFFKLLKQFNKEFDAELYLNDDGELADRKLVVLDSSDSDVAPIDEIVTTNTKKRKSRVVNDTKTKKRKILANPYSVIAKLNESTSQNASELPKVTSLGIEKYFDKNWLPGEDDFGKAVPCSVTDAQHLLNDSQQLYDFMEDPTSFETWVDLKLTFYTHMEAVFSFEQDLTESRNLTNHSGLKPILHGALTEDWVSSEKLRIIKTNIDIEETSLRIHFDVYNRDVQNFRKTDPPTPHFRIVCIKESSRFPSTAEVRALHSKCDDNVTIAFGVVGIASITYLQIKPTDLPLVSEND